MVPFGIAESNIVGPLIGAILGSGLSGAIAMLIRTRADRQPAFVTSATQVAGAQDQLIENLREEVNRLEEALKRRDRRIDHQQEQIDRLERRIVELELDPPNHLG